MPGAAEGIAIVPVVAVGPRIPSRQSVNADGLEGKTDAHVAIPALGDDFNLEIVEAT